MIRLKTERGDLYFAGYDKNGSFRLTPHPLSMDAVNFMNEGSAACYAVTLNRMYPGMDFVLWVIQ